MARQRRRGTRGPPRRAAERRADRPRLAHRAEPGRRVDPGGAAGRRHPAHPAARRRTCPTRAAMVIASDQTAARAYAAVLTRLTGETPTVVLSDDPGSSARITEFSAGNEPVAGGGADGVRGRRRAAAGRRGVRHQRVDAAVLRAGDRAVRAVPPARRDGEHLPAVGAQPAAAGQRDGGPAQPRAGQAAPGVAGRSTTSTGRAAQGRTQRTGQRLRIIGRRRRIGSGDLRRLVVRHRDAGGQRRGGRLPRHPRPARRRRRCETCCGAGKKSSCHVGAAQSATSSTARRLLRSAAVDAWAAARAAP